MTSLEPGTGWSGDWTPNVIAGDCDEAVAIAHWDRLPDQILWRDSSGFFSLGVVAYHREGIDSVEFAVEGGTVETIDEWEVNADTGHYSYFIALYPDEFTDDQAYEVRARVIPDGPGTERILTWTFFDGGGLTSGTDHAEYWVDSISGTDGTTTTGGSSDPFLTVARALEEVDAFTSSYAGFGDQDGAVLNLVERTTAYVIDDATVVIDNDWPLTIRSSTPTGSKAILHPLAGTTSATGSDTYINVKSLRLEDIGVDVSNYDCTVSTLTDTSAECFRVDPSEAIFGEAELYFSDSVLVGRTLTNNPTQYSATATGGENGVFLIDPGSYRDTGEVTTKVFLADTSVSHIRGDNTLTEIAWARNVDVAYCNLGAFINVEAVIDCVASESFDTVDLPGTSAPEYAWSIEGDHSRDNALCDGLEAFDNWCGYAFKIQGVDAGTYGESNFAVVNCAFLPQPANSEPEALVTRDSDAVARHVIVQHVTIKGFPITYDDTSANSTDDFPCGLLDACAFVGFDALDTAPGTCATSWEGMSIVNDYLHEAWTGGGTGSLNLCPTTWSNDSQNDTFTVPTGMNPDQMKIKSGAQINMITLSSSGRHKYALRAVLRGNNTGDTAPGGRTQVGE